MRILLYLKFFIVIVYLQCLTVQSHGITQTFEPQPKVLNMSGMATCCKRHSIAETEWPVLMQCINTTSIQHEQQLRQDGTARIGIVTFATKNIWEYTTYSFGIGQVYAEHHGYMFKHLDENSEGCEAFDSRDSRWNKIKILEQALNGWGKDMDYIMWIDADVAILDMGLRIEDVVAQHPAAHLWSSAEHAGSTTLINSGTLIVRVSTLAKQILKAWWQFGDRSLFSDQEQFDVLYTYCEKRWAAALQRKPYPDTKALDAAGVAHAKALEGVAPFDIHDAVVILPPDALNSDPPAMTQQRPHNQILHLMGEHTAYRKRVFRTGLQELCRFRNYLTDREVNGDIYAKKSAEIPDPNASDEGEAGGGPGRLYDLKKNITEPDPNALKQQLGLHQEKLLQWTLDVYGIEAKEALAKYVTGASQGAYGVGESRHLANSVHHYAHALVTKDGGEKLSDALDLRMQVWQLLKKNVDSRRVADRETPVARRAAVKADWPELLKVTAEAGQQLVANAELPLSTRHEIAADVVKLLNEILTVCHKAQQPAVLHMVAHMQSESAMLYLQEERRHDSLVHFHKSLQLYRELSSNSGIHILVQPLVSLSNVLCTMGHHSQAFPLFDEAIRIAESVLGLRHYSLANHYLNYGIAKMDSGAATEGLVLLRKVLYLCEINNSGLTFGGIRTVNVDICRRAFQHMQSALIAEITKP